MSRMLSKMNLISVVQQLPNEDIETIQGYVEMIEEESQKQKEVIDKATDIINDYLKEDYSIYTENEIEVDLIVKLRNILKEVSE